MFTPPSVRVTVIPPASPACGRTGAGHVLWQIMIGKEPKGVGTSTVTGPTLPNWPALGVTDPVRLVVVTEAARLGVKGTGPWRGVVIDWAGTRVEAGRQIALATVQTAGIVSEGVGP